MQSGALPRPEPVTTPYFTAGTRRRSGATCIPTRERGNEKKASTSKQLLGLEVEALAGPWLRNRASPVGKMSARVQRS